MNNQLFEYIFKNRKLISNIFIKLRPDKNSVDKFFNEFKKFELDYKIINNIFDDRTKNYIFIGSASTLLLDIASTGRLVLSFDNKSKQIFDSPVRKFVDFYKGSKNILNKDFIFNPIYISKKDSFKKYCSIKICYESLKNFS